MGKLSRITQVGIIFMCLCGFIGCGDGPAAAPTGSDAAADPHDHDEEGPHGGHIIELGTETHHAELTHDEESHRIGIYFVGDDAKTAKPIAAKSVTINVSEDGKPSQYTLPAVPQPGDSEGSSSYFEIVSEPLCDVVCGESEADRTHARINVTIDDKPYVGLIETDPHEHDHDHAH